VPQGAVFGLILCFRSAAIAPRGKRPVSKHVGPSFSEAAGSSSG
jgi:hypothetical protein